MSAFSASNKGAALALGVALALLGSLPHSDASARVRRASVADTVREAKRVIIGDGGVRIIEDEADADPTVSSARRGNGDLVEINRDGIRIHKALGDTITIREVDRGFGPRVVIDGDQSGVVRLFSDAEVAPGEKVEGDVVAVFGSVLVEGEVTGDVVSVFGSVKLGPKASVGRDVVSIGGGLEQTPGAIVGGQSVSLGFLPMQWGVPPIKLLFTTVLTCWLLSLFMGWLLTLVFPRQMLRIAITASRRAPGSFFLGVFSTPLLVIAIVLLLVTVIGIPIAFLLPPVYLFSLWAGQLAASYVLGCRLLRRRLGEGQPMGAMAAGTLFVAMFFGLGAMLSGPAGLIRTFALFFTLLGVLLVLALSVIGIGAVLLSRFGSRPRELENELVSPPSVAPTAVPSATPVAPPIS